MFRTNLDTSPDKRQPTHSLAMPFGDVVNGYRSIGLADRSIIVMSFFNE